MTTEFNGLFLKSCHFMLPEAEYPFCPKDVTSVRTQSTETMVGVVCDGLYFRKRTVLYFNQQKHSTKVHTKPMHRDLQMVDLRSHRCMRENISFLVLIPKFFSSDVCKHETRQEKNKKKVMWSDESHYTLFCTYEIRRFW